MFHLLPKAKNFRFNLMKTWHFIPEFIKYIETDFVLKLKDDDAINPSPLDEESILGDLFINWIRRNHPEIWPD